MRNSHKSIFYVERQRLCSSGFLRTCFLNSKSNDSVNAVFTETTFNDCARLELAERIVVILHAQNVSHNHIAKHKTNKTSSTEASRASLGCLSPPVCCLMPQLGLGGYRVALTISSMNSLSERHGRLPRKSTNAWKTTCTIDEDELTETVDIQRCQ